MQPSGDVLAPDARAALQRAAAKPLSYGVRVLQGPGDAPRLVVLLGEAHLKLGEAARLGKDVVEHLALRGVETFQSKQVFAGQALRWLIYMPRILLRVLSFGLVKDSTIVDAKQASHGYTVEIERAAGVPFSLHLGSLCLTVFFTVAFATALLTPLTWLVPVLAPLLAWLALASAALQAHMMLLIPAFLLRRWRFAWLVHPAIAILTSRDRIMAAGIERMLAAHPSAGPALVILGRAHVAGVETLLIERGFSVDAEAHSHQGSNTSSGVQSSARP